MSVDVGKSLSVSIDEKSTNYSTTKMKPQLHSLTGFLGSDASIPYHQTGNNSLR